VIEQASSGAPHGAFLATPEGWRFDGTLTMDTAAAVMASANALPLPETGRVDFGGLAQGDSSALAVIMALRRRALSEKRALRIENLPQALLSLAVAYGVDDITHGTA
jgi:phospholipid transport system transporter-binding protein